MNQKSASVLNKNIFRQESISFAEIPNQTKLFLDYQNNAENLEKFFPSLNQSLKDVAEDVLANYSVNRNELCNILLEENKSYNVAEKTLENIQKLRKSDCVAVLTGQQAGLFSGPIFTIYKAFSAIKLAEDLTEQAINAVPIFWVASEDHDFDEINKTIFLDKNGELLQIENIPEDITEDSPVGFISITKNITDSLDNLFDNQTETDFTDFVKDLLTDTYKEGETFSTSFGKLLAKIFKDYGLIFISALNEDLRKLSKPIFSDAIENSEAIAKNLIKRDVELNEQDYHSQVLVEESFFPFFYIDKQNKRNSLRFDFESKKIQSQDSKYEFTKSELIEIANTSPEKLSPKALMRPIVQDFLFPTVCYFGGGAEIAYFAQNQVIYEILRRPNTPIRHRSSFTIIQGKHRRTLEKYEFDFTTLFDAQEAILAEVIEKYINPATSNLFDETKELIDTKLNQLDRALSVEEPSLAANLENRRRKILWHIGAMRKKFHQAETLKNEVINRRINSLFTNTLPKEVLQERNINSLHFLNLYGENFIRWIYNALDSNEKEHQVIIF